MNGSTGNRYSILDQRQVSRISLESGSRELRRWEHRDDDIAVARRRRLYLELGRELLALWDAETERPTAA